jgi:hypothetical protein
MDYWLGINHGICNGNITVAISWSDYFGLLKESGGIIYWGQWIPDTQYANSIFIIRLYRLTLSPATDLYGTFIIIDYGLSLSRNERIRNASNVMVVVKLCIILLVIAVGVFYVDMDNWTPLRLTV